jgi:membrane protein
VAFDGITRRVAEARERRPLLDHAVLTVEHYGAVKGNLQAGAITFFAFVSFFPVLALAFAVVGYLAQFFPDAEETLVEAINSLLPGLVGDDPGQVSIDDIRDSAPSILSVGIVVVLYSGLAWLSSMRYALTVMFEMPQWVHPSFVLGKLRDLLALVALGLILLLSVGVSAVVRGASEQILDWIGFAESFGRLLGALAVLVGLAANALLFFVLFKVLADPDLPARALWSGALLGAVAFEVLKQVSQVLLAFTTNAPAFQAFGIALILVVWIYYFSRVVMYAAAWAYMHPAARALRPAPLDAAQGPQSPPAGRHDGSGAEPERPARRSWVAPFAAGVAAALVALAVLRRRTRPRLRSEPVSR